MRRLTASALALSLMAAVAAYGQVPGQGDDSPSPDGVPANGDRAASSGLVAAAPGGDHTPIMTIDQEELFLGSAWWRRTQQDIDERGRLLAEENERLVDRFSAEEQELTELRQTLPAAEFRKRADDFDRRVVEVRLEREEKLRELRATADREQDAFRQATLPILADMMKERGAVVVIDRRMTFVSADAIDVTEELIRRADEIAGPGPVARNLPTDSSDGAEMPAEPGPADPSVDAPAVDAPARSPLSQDIIPPDGPPVGPE